MTRRIALDDLGNPLLDQFSEEGFVDNVFRITEIETTDDSHTLLLAASHEGAKVGFRINLRRDIQGGFDAEMNLIRDHVYRSAVEFLRSGAESDALVAVLGERYGTSKRPARMVDRFAFTAIFLDPEGVDMDIQATRIKLFGCDSDEEIERGDYFESFLIVDLPGGWIFWNEKDMDYRVALLRGISVD